jgi:hypothetical protein
MVARAKRNVRGALHRHGVADVLGEDNFAPTIERALEASAAALR